jgi:Peptidase family M28
MRWNQYGRWCSWRGPALSLVVAAACGGPAEDADVAPEASLADEDEIYGWVEAVTGFGVRSAGSPASLQAATYVRDRFTAFGLSDVAIEDSNTLAWRASTWGLEVDGRELPCGAMQHTFHDGVPTSFSTGEEGLTAELVYVGDGRAADFEGKEIAGKIVVSNVRFQQIPMSVAALLGGEVYDPDATFPSDYSLTDPYSRVNFPQNYYTAQRSGAVGFIGILADYFESSSYHNEAYESYKQHLEDSAMNIPGVWLSPGVGAALAGEIEAAQEPPRAVLRLEGELVSTQGHTVVGYVRGQTDETILIESHHDSTTRGAVEDASGTAEVLALAQYYARVPLADRRRTLLFATMDTHFTDYASHRDFAERHLARENVLLGVTIEHVARDLVESEGGVAASERVAPRVMFVSNEVTGLGKAVSEAVRGNRLDRTVITPTLAFSGKGLPADCSGFFVEGLPVVALVGAPLYLYDELDSLEMVAKDNLPRVAQAFVDIVDFADEAPTDHFVRVPSGP